MFNFFYFILTLFALIFGVYFGIIKGEIVGFALGIIFFWTGTLPWILSIQESHDKKDTAIEPGHTGEENKFIAEEKKKNMWRNVMLTLIIGFVFVLIVIIFE